MEPILHCSKATCHQYCIQCEGSKCSAQWSRSFTAPRLHATNTVYSVKVASVCTMERILHCSKATCHQYCIQCEGSKCSAQWSRSITAPRLHATNTVYSAKVASVVHNGADPSLLQGYMPPILYTVQR